MVAATLLLERALLAVARAPGAALCNWNGALWLLEGPLPAWTSDDPLRARSALAQQISSLPAHPVTGAPAALLWLAYDGLRHDDPSLEGDRRPRGDRLPLACVQRYERAARVEPDDSLWPLAPASDPLHARWAAVANEALPALAPVHAASLMDVQAHERAVRALHEALREGDVYLCNLARMLHGPRLSAPQLAARVLRALPDRPLFVHGEHASVAGMSMELALRWDRASGELFSSPIKGTRPRDPDPTRDAALARELAADPKERAENAMAVDVHRNDFGRVAVPGSVTVPSLCEVAPHTYVHHLVSHVRALLRPEVTLDELLAATLPVGSITGAPKRSAMAHIAALEPERRGLYTGVYGAVGPGGLELTVAIRTLVNDVAGSHYGAGGGIVVRSRAPREWRELGWKQRALTGR